MGRDLIWTGVDFGSQLEVNRGDAKSRCGDGVAENFISLAIGDYKFDRLICRRELALNPMLYFSMCLTWMVPS